MRIQKPLLAALAALLIFACGEGGEGADTGGLRVTFANQNSEIAIAKVQWSLFKKGDETVLIDSGTIEEDPWELLVKDLAAGEYEIHAEAYVDSDETPSFEGSASFEIFSGQPVGSLTVVLHESDAGDAFHALRFVSIRASNTAPGFGERVEFTVEAAPGHGGALDELRIRVPTSQPEGFVSGAPEGPTKFDEGETVAKIGWTAPQQAGKVWFVLVITDTAGNLAEIGVDLQVVFSVDQEFNFELNTAPTASIHIHKILNDAEGTHLFLGVTYDDDRADSIEYEWSWACESFDLDTYTGDLAVRWRTGGTDSYDHTVTGSIDRGKSRNIEFHIERPPVEGEDLAEKRAQREHLEGDCKVTVQLEEDLGGGGVLTSSYSLTFDATWLEVDTD